MDSKTLVLLLLFCLMFLQDASDITHAHAQVHEPTTRKMLKMIKEGKWGGANREEEEKSRGLGLNEELRTSPSGPDPLHHHVNPPRQPRNYFHLP
ncbi:Protein CLAVATA 3 [Cardamine amara subsp. amara]|uniref:Protein CLAVATA 3 n=1 Tax=Cardamine amara subsp. amara TaxID=228776 RepID=A0ABD1C8S2_CARAN